ncbi:hypothetical protein AX17_005745 [Amanita inopinata Kibby_2008]|nr:hypothetical protein AX17_005745 [Amanita inopinata Kibby_2008]
MQHSNRYHVENGSDAQCYQSRCPPASSSVPYASQPSYFASQYNAVMDERSQQAHQTQQFIPTPSELTQTYADYSRHMSSPQPPSHPEQYAASAEYTSSRGSQQPVRISTTSRPRSGVGSAASPTSASSSSGERFPCEKCGKTFSRSHDRKRHHETQHLPTPVVHRCRYCEKEFSRQVF